MPRRIGAKRLIPIRIIARLSRYESLKDLTRALWRIAIGKADGAQQALEAVRTEGSRIKAVSCHERFGPTQRAVGP